MTEIRDYILAKQALADLDVCLLGNRQAMPVNTASENYVYGYGSSASTFALPDFRGDLLMWNPVRHSAYAESCLDLLADLIAIYNSQSDSQSLSQRHQRARDIRAVNLQAQTPLARVYDFEKPFPEERLYSPQIPEAPRILKLRK